MYHKLILCGMIVIGLAGCESRSQRPHVKGGNSIIQLEPIGTISTDTTVNYIFADGLVVLAVWSDWGGSTASGSSNSPDKMDFNGSIDRRGQSVKWNGTANAVGDGGITIAGTKYDLASGHIFLVTQIDGAVSVRQLKRGRTKAAVFPEFVQDLATENEVGAFFGTSTDQSKTGNGK